MNLVEFSMEYRVRTRRDECGEPIIRGRLGHVYDHGDGSRFGVLLMLPTKARWTWAKKKLRAAGFQIHQDAETQGTALFNPDSPEQVRLALKMVGAKRRRTPSPTQLESLARSREARRIVQPSARRATLAPGSMIGSGLGISTMEARLADERWSA